MQCNMFRGNVITHYCRKPERSENKQHGSKLSDQPVYMQNKQCFAHTLSLRANLQFIIGLADLASVHPFWGIFCAAIYNDSLPRHSVFFPSEGDS